MTNMERSTEKSKGVLGDSRLPIGRSVSAGSTGDLLRSLAGLLAANRLTMLGVALLALTAIAAIASPLIYPGDPLEMVARPLLWPGQDRRYLLGTDSLGRDVAAGLFHGARISLSVGFSGTFIGAGIGIAVGAVAGYAGGWVDAILSRVVEIFQTLPTFVLVVILVATMQPSITTIALAIGITSWPTIARLVRAEYRSLREKEFVLAARSLGYGHLRIVLSEILPNALPSIIVTSSVMVATAILMESALSFMGLGDPNAVSWGSMIGAGREMIRSAWYLTAIPGLAIVVVVIALNLVGDGLNDVLNPRTGERAR